MLAPKKDPRSIGVRPKSMNRITTFKVSEICKSGIAKWTMRGGVVGWWVVVGGGGWWWGGVARNMNIYIYIYIYILIYIKLVRLCGPQHINIYIEI